MIRSVSLIPCILGNTIFVWSTNWSWRVYVHVAWPCLLFHDLLTLLNLLQFFVIRSVFLMPFNLGLSYLVHTLMMEGKKRVQVWLTSVQRFQRRRFKCEKLTDGRRTLTHDKSSHGLWPGELKRENKSNGWQCNQ
jgi:hypothetical protein